MPKLNGFTKKEILEVYYKMSLSRALDEKMLILLKQGKSFFHMGASGHEAAQLAAASLIKEGKDWSYPYYRDSAYCLGLGMTAREQLLSFLSKADDPNSGGRQMPMHYGHKDLRIISQSSPTGSQFLQALGSALAAQYDDSNDIVYVSSGEGTTSQGDFHEALNWASNSKAPIIFHIQDNEYAISTHRSEQSADSVYTRAAGYKNLTRYDVDGTDFFETHLAFKKACERGRKGQGPSVIISNVVRLLPHSSSDDQRKYRTKDDLSQDLERDPLLILKNQCLEKKFISEKEFENITSQVKEQINTDVIWADEQSYPDESTALDHIYSMDPPIAESTFKPIRDSVVIVDAINHALKEEMAINDKMIIYGQDIADPKGGVFTATKGLSDEFGMKRVFNSPLAESSIVGTAIGLAVTGYKPVIEIQFGDYIWTAMNQIRNEVVTMRYRSNNSWNCPIVIRTPVGGYIHGGLCHSQSIDGYFIHMPGIYLAYPSNAADAKGLLKMACRMNDPVLFMEHKGLYRQGYASTQEPDEDYVIPFGKGRLVSAGDTISIITWGAMVQKSVEAVKSLELDDGLIEIIDLRTLNPLDIDMIKKSVEKTGKALIVYEDNLTNGPGAEISAIISEQCFEFLDGPIKRIASKDSPVPFNWFLEEKVLPQAEDIALGIKELMEY
jgi:2-oxoisovalerate dehydrogenase E1 component|tara:strand:+ start:576 stop:2579 length:2004 start_codon:yes stop_codon:yes gene_type:complete